MSERRTPTGKTVLMYWDCEYCGTKNISGLKRECPYCGHPRSIGTNFHFIEGHQKEYIDEETAKKIGDNPDWLCSFCDSLNSANDDICPSCSASREDSSKNYFEMKKEREEKAKLKSVTYQSPKRRESDDEEELEEETHSSSFFDKVKGFFSSYKLPLIIGILGILFISIFLWISTHPVTKTINVTGFSWQRSIDIEEFKTVEESDWSLPNEARLKDSKTEFKEYIEVLDHYEEQTVTKDSYEVIGSHTEYEYVDNGNGTASEIAYTVDDYGWVTRTSVENVPIYRTEPVYATKYYYEIDKWIFTRTVESSGKDKNAYWGETNLKENEREMGRIENYSILCTSGKKEKECEYTTSYDLWELIPENTNVKVEIIFGEIIDILEIDGEKFVYPEIVETDE